MSENLPPQQVLLGPTCPQRAVLTLATKDLLVRVPWGLLCAGDRGFGFS